jgi:hypothetical protein
VWEFPTFTDNLGLLANWLIACGITTVAMVSTINFRAYRFGIEVIGINPAYKSVIGLVN